MAVVFGLQAFYNVATTGSVLGQMTNISGSSLLAATNDQRVAHNETPLVLNKTLNEAAREKADDMFKHQYWAHVSPSGVQPWAWFDNAGYRYQEAGENLAKGFHSSGAVVTAWMESKEHRENILDANYRDVGFAVVSGMLQGKETTLVVAMYGEPASTATVAAAQTKQVITASPQQLSLAARFGVALQSVTPALLASIILLLVGIVVALAAHVYRKQLPKPIRQSWHRHHGLYKAVGMASLVIMLVTLYGGGQI